MDTVTLTNIYNSAGAAGQAAKGNRGYTQLLWAKYLRSEGWKLYEIARFLDIPMKEVKGMLNE